MNPGHTVNIAGATLGDTRSIADLLADAFHHDPVSGWLLPDERQRRRQHLGLFHVFVEHAVRHGDVAVHCDNGYRGAALWLEAGTGQDTEPDMTRVQEALGDEGFERFMVLDELMQRHHPVDVRHAYLPFIGVRTEWQGRGIGRLLLETKLDQLDEAGIPAYLEASSGRSCFLYRRVGFLPLGDPFALPGGPQLHPMWREPKRQPQPGNSRRDAVDRKPDVAGTAQW